jgi:hypothetical protein
VYIEKGKHGPGVSISHNWQPSVKPRGEEGGTVWIVETAIGVSKKNYIIIFAY